MKVKPEHYAHMRDAIREHVELLALSAEPHREAQWLARGLTARRYRWDLTYGAKLTPFICDKLYRYASDTHIDTALRQIVRDLNLGKGL